MIDNTTPMNADEYDKKIDSTIAFYHEFYDQTIDVIEQCGFDKLDWLDLGCGTGTMQVLALKKFSDVHFVLCDPSEKMLEQAKNKLGDTLEYFCLSSEKINFSEQFNVVTAIQSHHYMQKESREKATANVFFALRKGGIFISFENVVPQDNELLDFELKRWGRYQQRHGKTLQQANEHNARCGKNYFPLTVPQHIELLKKAGFSKVYVFWRSYMQTGIMGIK